MNALFLCCLVWLGRTHQRAWLVALLPASLAAWFCSTALGGEGGRAAATKSVETWSQLRVS